MKKIYNKKNIIIISVLIVLLIFIMILLFYNPFIYFKVQGKKNIILNVNEELKLPKVKAYVFNINISNKIKVYGKANINKVGSYEIKYKLKYFFTKKSIVIKINVVDNEKPKIILNGNANVSICPNSKYIEEGYSAMDNYDGEITNKVIVKEFDNFKEYSIKDSSNNNFSIKRTIIKEDKESPIINLNGNINNIIIINSNFNDLGYTAFDNCDGDIGSNVEVINNLDITKIGNYQIIYKVKDSSNNETSVFRNVKVVSAKSNTNYSDIIVGPTYIDGILIVNKKYALPVDFGGTNHDAINALYELQNAASLVGFSIPLLSGYRSYYTQQTLYNNYVNVDGKELADTYSARPGFSEHQTGLAFDVGNIDDNYGDTPEGIWLKNNCHLYGFIIRYPKGKEHITGYQYEPWHIRYLGIEHATNVYNKGVTLEEYLRIS